VLGFHECSGNNPCAVHDRWGGIRDDISTILMSKSIARLAKEMKKPGYRIFYN